MPTSAGDLEVFVLTHNRACFLEQTLISLSKQTARGFRIVVLDNGSTDNTPEIVKMFAPHGVELYRSEKNLGGLENFNRAKDLAGREWVMVFHDDDLLHPGYIEVAMNGLNRQKDCVLTGAAMTFEAAPQNQLWPALSSKAIICRKAPDFAALLYRGFPFHYGSAIYRTGIFKRVPVEWKTYGKIADRPFLLDIAQHGSVAVFKSPYVKYRCHPGQDSAAGTSGPFIPQLIALHGKYLQLLGSNPLTSGGRAFIANNYRCLYDEFDRLTERETLTKKQYIQKALQEHASTKLAVWYGRLVTGVCKL